MAKDQNPVNALREQVVKELIATIEKNPSAWQSGWNNLTGDVPYNGKTNKAYRGINSIYLKLMGLKNGYADPRWVTFNQAKDLGASVKRGEKSVPVFYFGFYDKNTKKEYNPFTTENMTDEEKKKYLEENVYPISKMNRVFNAEQCKSFPKLEVKGLTEEELANKNETIEMIIATSAAPITYDGGNRAYYSPGEDVIHLPPIRAFDSVEDFYATALHEIAHSTGHESRLNRDLLGGFGSESYAIEELRAEIASVFMQNELGVQIDGKHIENHAAYLKSWLAVVKKDYNVFFKAASDAQRISDYVAEHYMTSVRESDAEEEREMKMAQEAEHEKENEAGATSKAQEVAEPIFSRDLPFAAQVDAVLSGADTTSTHIQVMPNTPDLLREVGMQNLPIMMTAEHLKSVVRDSGTNSANYHGLGETVKELPALLSDPVMILDSLTRDDSIVVITETQDKENRPVIGAIMFNGIARRDSKIVSANILTSVYGKDNFQSFLNHNLQAGTLIYWNKEKSQALSVNLGIQFPDVMASLDSDTIIRKAAAFVNTFSENSSKNSERTRTDENVSTESVSTNAVSTENVSTNQVGTENVGTEKHKEEIKQERATPTQNALNTPENEKPRRREWFDVELPNGAVEREYGANKLIRMPSGGEYQHFALFVPSRLIREENGKTVLRASSDFKYRLNNDGRQVELTADELKRSFSGETIGKKWERYKPSKRTVESLLRLEKNVPEEMKDIPNWCCYNTRWNAERGKKDKFLYSAVSGKLGVARDNPSEWTTFERALEHAKENNYEGLAFAFDGKCGLTCIDLDKCADRETGKRSAFADTILKSLSGTYIERSTSGNGFHLFVKGDVISKEHKTDKQLEDDDFKGSAVEVKNNMFIASITGDRISEGSVLTECNDDIKKLLCDTLGKEKKAVRSEKPKSRSSTLRSLSEQEVIDKITHSKAGAAFTALMNGQSVIGNRSQDDMRLAGILAWATEGDSRMCLQIMRSAGIYRPDKSDDYYKHTIDKAIQNTFNYSPTTGAGSGAVKSSFHTKGGGAEK